MGDDRQAVTDAEIAAKAKEMRRAALDSHKVGTYRIEKAKDELFNLIDRQATPQQNSSE
jgi:hypothetical protein